MVLNYDALSTWQTPDLLFRDSRLINKTRVMGMSEKEAVIHIVALVCTAGASLPINLTFCIWHSHRYGKVKKERMWIRQILGTRNMAYQGRGQWFQVQPTNNATGNATNNTTNNATNNCHHQDSGRNDKYDGLACICQLLSFCAAPQ